MPYLRLAPLHGYLVDHTMAALAADGQHEIHGWYDGQARDAVRDVLRTASRRLTALDSLSSQHYWSWHNAAAR